MFLGFKPFLGVTGSGFLGFSFFVEFIPKGLGSPHFFWIFGLLFDSNKPIHADCPPLRVRARASGLELSGCTRRVHVPELSLQEGI